MKPSINSESYITFLDQFPDPVYEPLEEFGWKSVSELEWQSRWFEGNFGTEFVTMDGKRVEIIDFGIWNHSPGPDFIHCAGRIDGNEFRGDIELDTCLQDWDSHGHRDNPSFQNVKLHLHLWSAQPEQEFFVRTADHRLVPQIRLDPTLGHPRSQNVHLMEVRLGKCAEQLKRMSDSQIQQLLSSAANHRIRLKGELYRRKVQVHGKDQAAYQSLANALGYTRNSQNFTILAQRLSFRELGKLPSKQFESLFFGVSGFLENQKFDRADKTTQIYLRSLWENWWQLRHEYLRWLEPDQLIPWDFTSTRPMNHPQRRLSALVVLLQKWRSTQKILFPKAIEDLRYAEVLKYLEHLSHDYWQHHFTLNSSYQRNPMSLIGKVRAHEIYVNVILPIFWKDSATLWQHFLNLTAPDINHQVRRAALRLFGEGTTDFKWLKKAVYQQGLLQIYRDFCLKDYSACEQCEFPHWLSRQKGNDS